MYLFFCKTPKVQKEPKEEACAFMDITTDQYEAYRMLIEKEDDVSSNFMHGFSYDE